MTKEEETVQINQEVKDVLAKHPNFALTAVPFVDASGSMRARPILMYIKGMNKESVLQA